MITNEDRSVVLLQLAIIREAADKIRQQGDGAGGDFAQQCFGFDSGIADISSDLVAAIRPISRNEGDN